jgi:hypothetical protein
VTLSAGNRLESHIVTVPETIRETESTRGVRKLNGRVPMTVIGYSVAVRKIFPTFGKSPRHDRSHAGGDR